MEERATNKRQFIYPWGWARTIWSCAQMNLEITMLFFILISTKSTHHNHHHHYQQKLHLQNHHHCDHHFDTSTQRPLLQLPGMVNNEQGGLETPRWVFSCYYYYFLLTNYLHLGYMLLPPSTTLPWPHRPQPAPASHKDSLVQVASPSTMQAPTSHYDLLVLFFGSPLTMVATTSTNKSLWLVGALLSLLPRLWQPQQAPMSHYDSLVLPCRPLHPHFDLMWHHHLSTPNDNDNKSSVFFFSLIFYFISFLYYNFTSTSSVPLYSKILPVDSTLEFMLPSKSSDLLSGMNLILTLCLLFSQRQNHWNWQTSSKRMLMHTMLKWNRAPCLVWPRFLIGYMVFWLCLAGMRWWQFCLTQYISPFC